MNHKNNFNPILLSVGGGSEIGGDCDEWRNCDCGCDFDLGVALLPVL